MNNALPGRVHPMKKPIDGFIFDLDGTVYLGDEALPCVIETIAHLRNRHKKILFISNKPLDPARVYAEKLTRLGIPSDEQDIITSAYVLGYHISQTEPDLRLYVVGEENLIQELRDQGLDIVEQFYDQDSMNVIIPEGIDAVVIAFDRTLDYRKLNTAYQAIKQGARFFATNGDKVCPMPNGAIPDAGAIIAALEHITGREVELVAGKPSRLMMKVALQRLSLPPERCLMVGDRLETDIKMGQESRMATAVVLTGVSTREDAEKMTDPPDFILENLGELLNLVS
jgi:arabinose operon protein AraL